MSCKNKQVILSSQQLGSTVAYRLPFRLLGLPRSDVYSDVNDQNNSGNRLPWKVSEENVLLSLAYKAVYGEPGPFKGQNIG